LRCAAAPAEIAANIQIVTAALGTQTFNEQLAQVNLMTRLVFLVATTAAFGIAIRMIYRAGFMSLLPSASGQPWYEVDIWHALRERNSRPACD